MTSFTRKESNEAYHLDTEYVSSSPLKLYKRSPLHKTVEKDKTDALIFGGAYHCMVLEPEIFFDIYFVFDDREIMQKLSKDFTNIRLSKPYKEFKEDEYLKAEGREIIPIDDFLTMQTMYKALMSHRFVYWLFTQGINELSHYTVLNGVKTKIKPDSIHLKHRIIADLKTTVDASYDTYYHEAAKRGSHISGALYCDVAEQMYPNDIKPFKFMLVVQEKTAPFAVAVYETTYNFLAIGRYEYEMLLQQHKYCQETGIYEGYEVFSNNKYGIINLGFPAYKNREYMFYNQFAKDRKYMRNFKLEKVAI